MPFIHDMKPIQYRGSTNDLSLEKSLKRIATLRMETNSQRQIMEEKRLRKEANKKANLQRELANKEKKIRAETKLFSITTPVLNSPELQKSALDHRSAKRRIRKSKKSRRKNRRSDPQRGLRHKHDAAKPNFSPFYVTYMKSEAWQSKRMEAFNVHGKQCVTCGGFKKLQCHHLTYERLGNENAKTDLEILCQSCHQKEHGRTF